MLIKRYDKLEIDKGLQTQVDQYFEQDTKEDIQQDIDYIKEHGSDSSN